MDVHGAFKTAVPTGDGRFASERSHSGVCQSCSHVARAPPNVAQPTRRQSNAAPFCLTFCVPVHCVCVCLSVCATLSLIYLCVWVRMQPLSSEIDIVHRGIKRFGSGRSTSKDTSRGRQMQPQGSHNPNQKLLYSFVLVQSRTCCFLLCRFGGCLNRGRGLKKKNPDQEKNFPDQIFFRSQNNSN